VFLSMFSAVSLFLISGACRIVYIFVVSLRFKVVLSFSFVRSISVLLSLSAFPPIIFPVFLSSFIISISFFLIFLSSLLFHGPG